MAALEGAVGSGAGLEVSRRSEPREWVRLTGVGV